MVFGKEYSSLGNLTSVDGSFSHSGDDIKATKAVTMV
jgi:hypothetical protein